MFRIGRSEWHLCQGVSRREFIRVGGLSVLGLTLGDLFALKEAKAVGDGTAKACIILYMVGGPSHMETFDLKPDAPPEYRGTFNPIETNVPGIRISEHLPKLAKHADKYAILRSVTHTDANHPLATHWMLTGYPYNPVVEHPHYGSVLTKVKGTGGPLPTFVSLPYKIADVGFGLVPIPGQGAGFLGKQYDPLFVLDNPNDPNFKVKDISPLPGVSVKRLEDRRSLLQAIDQAFRQLERHPLMQSMNTAYQRAYSLITSEEARRAFDINQEPDKVRERYGRNPFGQSCLLARRLVEAGVKLVTVYFVNDPGNGESFDTHGDNFNRLKNFLLPRTDPAVSSLLEDLNERGLLDETLVVMMGEFGRTPRINGAAGRDHWPACASVMMAGGGVKGGQVIGESDERGEYPKERPITPEDIAATIYHCIGIDPEQFIPQFGRMVKILERGDVVHELL